MSQAKRINPLLAILTLPTLSACGMVGDTGAVKDANELAIECRTDEALAAVAEAEQESLADLRAEREKETGSATCP